jgi:hypothetical protein
MKNRELQAQNTAPKRQLKYKEQQQKRKGQAEGEEEGGKQTHTKKNQEREKKKEKEPHQYCRESHARRKARERRRSSEEQWKKSPKATGRTQGIGTTGVVAKRDKAREEKKRATNEVPLSIPWPPLAPSPQAHLPGFLEPAARNVFHFSLSLILTRPVRNYHLSFLSFPSFLPSLLP